MRWPWPPGPRCCPCSPPGRATTTTPTTTPGPGWCTGPGSPEARRPGHTAWARRVLTHPKVVAALAAATVSESVGRVICRWTDKLPGDRREAADQILLDAAAGGLGLEDLASLFAAMYEKVRAEAGDDDDGKTLADRSVRLAATTGGAGVMHGDLTPECAEAVGKVLDALSAPAGDEDDRSQEQRSARSHAFIEKMHRDLGHIFMV